MAVEHMTSSGSCLDLFVKNDKKCSAMNNFGTEKSSNVRNFKAVPFTSCFEGVNEYVQIMIEDLAAWLNDIYHIELRLDNFFESLDNGVLLCQHANNLQRLARSYVQQRLEKAERCNVQIPTESVFYRPQVPRGTFLARDNVENFIRWCRDQIGVPDSLLFEVDDLILRKNVKNFVLCLLEVSRKGRKFGMRIPALLALDASVDREEKELAKLERKLPSRISLNSTGCNWEWLRDVDQAVARQLALCRCLNSFDLQQEAPGRYTMSNHQRRVFIRKLRTHTVVRFSNETKWILLKTFFNNHDPCRMNKSVKSLEQHPPFLGELKSKQNVRRQLDYDNLRRCKTPDGQSKPMTTFTARKVPFCRDSDTSTSNLTGDKQEEFRSEIRGAQTFLSSIENENLERNSKFKRPPTRRVKTNGSDSARHSKIETVIDDMPLSPQRNMDSFRRRKRRKSKSSSEARCHSSLAEFNSDLVQTGSDQIRGFDEVDGTVKQYSVSQLRSLLGLPEAEKPKKQRPQTENVLIKYEEPLNENVRSKYVRLENQTMARARPRSRISEHRPSADYATSYDSGISVDLTNSRRPTTGNNNHVSTEDISASYKTPEDYDVKGAVELYRNVNQSRIRGPDVVFLTDHPRTRKSSDFKNPNEVQENPFRSNILTEAALAREQFFGGKVPANQPTVDNRDDCMFSNKPETNGRQSTSELRVPRVLHSRREPSLGGSPDFINAILAFEQPLQSSTPMVSPHVTKMISELEDYDTDLPNSSTTENSRTLDQKLEEFTKELESSKVDESWKHQQTKTAPIQEESGLVKDEEVLWSRYTPQIEKLPLRLRTSHNSEEEIKFLDTSLNVTSASNKNLAKSEQRRDARRKNSAKKSSVPTPNKNNSLTLKQGNQVSNESIPIATSEATEEKLEVKIDEWIQRSDFSPEIIHDTDDMPDSNKKLSCTGHGIEDAENWKKTSQTEDMGTQCKIPDENEVAHPISFRNTELEVLENLRKSDDVSSEATKVKMRKLIAELDNQISKPPENRGFSKDFDQKSGKEIQDEREVMAMRQPINIHIETIKVEMQPDKSAKVVGVTFSDGSQNDDGRSKKLAEGESPTLKETYFEGPEKLIQLVGKDTFEEIASAVKKEVAEEMKKSVTTVEPRTNSLDLPRGLSWDETPVKGSTPRGKELPQSSIEGIKESEINDVLIDNNDDMPHQMNATFLKYPEDKKLSSNRRIFGENTEENDYVMKPKHTSKILYMRSEIGGMSEGSAHLVFMNSLRSLQKPVKPKTPKNRETKQVSVASIGGISSAVADQTFAKSLRNSNDKLQPRSKTPQPEKSDSSPKTVIRRSKTPDFIRRNIESAGQTASKLNSRSLQCSRENLSTRSKSVESLASVKSYNASSIYKRTASVAISTEATSESTTDMVKSCVFDSIDVVHELEPREPSDEADSCPKTLPLESGQKSENPVDANNATQYTSVRSVKRKSRQGQIARDSNAASRAGASTSKIPIRVKKETCDNEKGGNQKEDHGSRQRSLTPRPRSEERANRGRSKIAVPRT